MGTFVFEFRWFDQGIYCFTVPLLFPVDFNIPSEYLSLPPLVSAMSQHCTSINIIDDLLPEMDESFFLTVSGGNYITAPADAVELVIIDNDGTYNYVFLDLSVYLLLVNVRYLAHANLECSPTNARHSHFITFSCELITATCLRLS